MRKTPAFRCNAAELERNQLLKGVAEGEELGSNGL
jgi:hypothetical protein